MIRDFVLFVVSVNMLIFIGYGVYFYKQLKTIRIETMKVGAHVNTIRDMVTSISASRKKPEPVEKEILPRDKNSSSILSGGLDLTSHDITVTNINLE